MKRIFLVLFISLFTAISVFAADNVLQSVQVEPSGDTFNIVLVSDNTVPIKKTVQAPNRIMLTLKGIRVSKTLSTVYKNVSNVDNIIVEPFGVDGLNIMFQADNASNATVTFDSLVSSVKVEKRANPKKEILLNAPMNTYSPIYKNNLPDAKPSIIDSINVTGIISVLKSMFSGTRTGTLLTFGFFGLIFLLGAKLIRGKDNDIKVGLSQGLMERDIANTKDVHSLTPGYRNATSKPYTTMNYGLKAYQNSTQSPFLQMHTSPKASTVNDRMASLPKRNLMADSVTSQQRKPVNQQNLNAMRPVKAQKTAATMTQAKVQPRVDSVKFLESMSEIYEKSGRLDLANGIRTKLSKMK
ncbi:MAG: hypothetical protein ACI4S3_01215 [Candidatus Gastranaerophilaceae bacterium]